MINNYRRILAVSAHPDDIEIGCGGALAHWLKDQRTLVYYLIMTRGDRGGDGEVRMKEQERAAEKIGVHGIIWQEYEDTKIAVNQESISQVEAVMNTLKPDYILTHYENDTHQDHRALARIVITATRNRRNILFFEGPTSINFNPQVYVDIGETISCKRDALAAHKSQVTKTNIENRDIMEIANANAIFRGMEARVKYAEGFIPLRLFL